MTSTKSVYKQFRVLKTFYSFFAPASLTLTVVCWSVIYFSGLAAFGLLFWLKVLTLGLIYFFVNEDISRHFYYFQNLGYSRKQLWAWSLGFDFGLFIIGYLIILWIG
ncbi:hypothetical protein SAMN06295967_10914 [Belliella buryatensis]|uniref:Uncharacterized protein n=1 Tax=Belliella buryatensis TaxID=1500549 RepID=A0A239E827_9BACT|nr:hypothetical protein [Belliella buryatensis]SNS40619.1 hypothetical protein SAMN06295967_10914 [Belliella buryatensis]